MAASTDPTKSADSCACSANASSNPARPNHRRPPSGSPDVKCANPPPDNAALRNQEAVTRHGREEEAMTTAAVIWVTVAALAFLAAFFFTAHEAQYSSAPVYT